VPSYRAATVRFRRSVIKQRILTAAIVLPILVAFIAFSGPMLFNGALCLVSALAVNEFYQMGLPTYRRAEACLGVAAGVLLMMGLLFSSNSLIHLASIVFPTMLLMLIYLFRFHDLQQVGRDLAISLLGLFYIPMLLAHAGLLRGLPYGREWIFLVLVIVMVSDTMAYFVGMQLGRHRLYEAISPKKSIEGAIGGLAGGLLGALIGMYSFFPELHGVDAVLLGIGVGSFSQLGDLVESLLKRNFGVKDSGTLIPGHGGMLDRLDSLLFAFPLTFYYAVWVFR
jgi:phosphatidate cytidylyltransferase